MARLCVPRARAQCRASVSDLVLSGAPAAKLPTWVGVSLSDGSYGLYQVLKASPPTAETIAKQRPQYESQLVQTASQQDFSNYLDSLKARAKITKFEPKITDKAQEPR